MTTTYFETCTQADEATINDFLWSVKDDFFFTSKADIAVITQSLFDQGGVIAGYRDDQIVAMLGYFLGEPSREYRNKEIGFLYLTVLAESVRMTRFFVQGFHFVTQTLKTMGIKEMRFHARKSDAYTNRLYAHFAKLQGEEINLRGYNCNLYSTSMDEVIAYLASRVRA